jgi:hypothetical protein
MLWHKASLTWGFSLTKLDPANFLKKLGFGLGVALALGLEPGRLGRKSTTRDRSTDMVVLGQRDVQRLAVPLCVREGGHE